jgi:hypothetical protein
MHMRLQVGTLVAPQAGPIFLFTASDDGWSGRLIIAVAAGPDNSRAVGGSDRRVS